MTTSPLRFVTVIIFVMTLLCMGCSSGGLQESGPALTFNAAQKEVCLQMTAFCENDPKTTLQYNFAQNINDGSGITFGCIGFTTGTYSGNALIHNYTIINPANSLAKYIPALDRIDSEPHPGGKCNDTAGLENFINDVRNCSDPLFKQAQNNELDQKYWDPAVAKTKMIGARYPITLAFIYDTCVNHGSEGAQVFIDQANQAMGGSPAIGIDEREWLRKIISIRYNYLISRNWISGDRSNAFKRILDSGNVNLTIPFQFSCYGDTCVIDGNAGY